MKKLLFGMLAFAAFGMSHDASALIVFDLTGSPAVQSSFNITANDPSHSLTVTATAGDDPSYVIRSGVGMGVWSSLGDDPQLDGVGPDEALHFQLHSGPLRLLSASFTFVGANDEFTLTVDDEYLGEADIPGGGGLAGFFDLDTGTFDFSFLTIQGILFEFGVTDNNDDYKMTCITFEELDDQEPDPVVPEPATLALVGLGLSAAGMVRRRKA